MAMPRMRPVLFATFVSSNWDWTTVAGASFTLAPHFLPATKPDLHYAIPGGGQERCDKVVDFLCWDMGADGFRLDAVIPSCSRRGRSRCDGVLPETHALFLRRLSGRVLEASGAR